jgi:hypothetical protein
MSSDNPPAKSGRQTLADHRPAQRLCLGGCARMFASAGPGNRVCPKCAKAGLSLSRREMGESCDARR